MQDQIRSALLALLGCLALSAPPALAADFYHGPSKEIAIVGSPDAFLPVLRKRYSPRTVVAAGGDGRIPLLRGRTMVDNKPTAYVCENFACKQPVTGTAAFEEQLNAAEASL